MRHGDRTNRPGFYSSTTPRSSPLLKSQFTIILLALSFILLFLPSSHPFDCNGQSFKLISVVPDNFGIEGNSSSNYKLQVSIDSGLDFVKSNLLKNVSLVNYFVKTTNTENSDVATRIEQILLNGTSQMDNDFIGIIGGYSSTESLKIAEVSRKYGIPMISYASSFSKLSYNRYFYRV